MPQIVSNPPEDGLVLEESELLLELVRSIVRNPEKVSVDIARGKATSLLTLTVDPEDKGHVIGRDRRTLDAIKHLFSKAAFLDGRKVIIQLSGLEHRSQRRNGTRSTGREAEPVFEYRSRR
jgi:predicted RNA-binding protein YlqC (UPF0109 family)